MQAFKLFRGDKNTPVKEYKDFHLTVLQVGAGNIHALDGKFVELP